LKLGASLAVSGPSANTAHSPEPLFELLKAADRCWCDSWSTTRPKSAAEEEVRYDRQI
jgi:hypothetical protein